MKIIFLDFDGPLLPVGVSLPNHSNGCARMDPYGVMYVNMLLEADPNIKLVISSNHALSGFEHCKTLLATNGIDIGAIHSDWMTPRRMSSGRYDEIALWLKAHPEVDYHVAIDDLPISDAFGICSTRASNEDGICYWNYLECRFYLALWRKHETPYDVKAQANYHKTKSVMRHMPRSNNLWISMSHLCDEAFPPRVTKDDQCE